MMKMLRGFGIFFIIAGLIIAMCGVVALMSPGSIPVSGGPALAVGIAVTLLGAITMISVHAQKVSFTRDER